MSQSTESHLLSQPDALKAAFVADPPSRLRDRILARTRLPMAVRCAPILASVLGLGLIVLSPSGPTRPDKADVLVNAVDWRERSAALERVWQQIGDRDWLRGDVRAASIERRLRMLDERLSRLSNDVMVAEQVTRLWRERSETLAELVSLRQQGGYAIRL